MSEREEASERATAACERCVADVSDLERRVRDSLQAQVDRAPMTAAPADRAIAQGRAWRRRGALITVGSLVVVVALGIGGFVLLNQPTPSALSASPTASATTTPLVAAGPRPDLLIEPATDSGGWHALLTASGQTIPFTAVGGTVDSAYRIPVGWLLGVRLSSQLWLLRADGTATRLLDGLDGYAVAPDGQRIAWRAGDRLRVGHMAGTSLVEDRSTAVPARGAPIAYTGTAVILGYSMTGGGIDQHDVWIPANGDYSPSWDAMQFVVAVYQPSADGSLLGLIGNPATGKQACLAVLDPAAGLRATRQACGLPITIDPAGLVSPDGRWLATTALSQDSRPETALIDLNAVFDHPAIAQTWAAAGPLAWVDASTLVLTSADRSLMLGFVGRQDLTTIAGFSLPVRKLVGPQ
jgi:hypothetical protein